MKNNMMTLKELRSFIKDDIKEITIDWEYQEIVRYRKCMKELFRDLLKYNNIKANLFYDLDKKDALYYQVYENDTLVMNIEFSTFGWKDTLNNKDYVICVFIPTDYDEVWKKEENTDIVFYI